MNAEPVIRLLRTTPPNQVNICHKVMSYVVSQDTHQSMLKIPIINAQEYLLDFFMVNLNVHAVLAGQQLD